MRYCGKACAKAVLTGLREFGIQINLIVPIMKKYFLFGFLIVIIMFACKKEKTEEPVTIQLNFTSLVADNDTILPGTTTNITANATGEGLVYTWTSTGGGNIIGSGTKISYATTPCMYGNYEVQCEVKDKAGSSQSKAITIRVQ